jgi:hypothetical protein
MQRRQQEARWPMFGWLRRWRHRSKSHRRVTPRGPAPKVDSIEELMRIVNAAQDRDAEDERRLGDPTWRNPAYLLSAAAPQGSIAAGPSRFSPQGPVGNTKLPVCRHHTSGICVRENRCRSRHIRGRSPLSCIGPPKSFVCGPCIERRLCQQFLQTSRTIVHHDRSVRRNV